MASITWQWRTFEELSAGQLYELLKLRQDVFVLEQQCLYGDLDNIDQISYHLMGRVEQDLAAYLRIIPKQIKQQDAMIIGRVLTADAHRGNGTGRALMTEALSYLAKHHSNKVVQLSAQHYLIEFYQSFGFKPISEPYDDDGILHVDMRLVSY